MSDDANISRLRGLMLAIPDAVRRWHSAHAVDRREIEREIQQLCEEAYLLFGRTFGRPSTNGSGR